jgi:hypothetical protein
MSDFNKRTVRRDRDLIVDALNTAAEQWDHDAEQIEKTDLDSFSKGRIARELAVKARRAEQLAESIEAGGEVEQHDVPDEPDDEAEG